MQADTHTTPMGSSRGKMARVMGIRIPKVTQLVPVAKANRQPMMNTMAGRNMEKSRAYSLTTYSTKWVAPRESVMAFRDQAKVRIMMAGTMALKPSGMQPIMSRKDMARRMV